MAESLATLGFHGQLPLTEVVPRAIEALERALTLDENLPEAHATLAWIRFFNDWNWVAAEREFRRALTLNPSLADAHSRFALMLMAQRRDDEAVAQVAVARDLDPLSFGRANDVGVVLLGAGRTRQALDHARRALRLSPGSRAAHGLAGVALATELRFDEATSEFETALQGGDRYTYLLGSLWLRARQGGSTGRCAQPGAGDRNGVSGEHGVVGAPRLRPGCARRLSWGAAVSGARD